MRLLLLLTLLILPLRAQSVLSGKVIGIADGDTITILADKQPVKIRLEGIDAPESGQEYGAKSKDALGKMIHGKTVSILATGTDKYGRTLGWVMAGVENINFRMIRDGWAWQFLKYNADLNLAALEKEAKQAKRGLWAAPNTPMPPWEYRALKSGTIRPLIPATPVRLSTATETPTTAPSSADSEERFWINSNGVRHNSGCRWYGKTKRGHYGGGNEGRACGMCGG